MKTTGKPGKDGRPKGREPRIDVAMDGRMEEDSRRVHDGARERTNRKVFRQFSGTCMKFKTQICGFGFANPDMKRLFLLTTRGKRSTHEKTIL